MLAGDEFGGGGGGCSRRKLINNYCTPHQMEAIQIYLLISSLIAYARLEMTRQSDPITLSFTDLHSAATQPHFIAVE